MARPHKCRWVGTAPEVTAFKPCGVPSGRLEVVELQIDELEAVRLADLEGLYQDAAAERMGVSRPTFGRLIASARHKIATALLGPRMLVFKGGSVMMRNMRSFTCTGCGASFEVVCGAGRPTECPSCHGTQFHRAEEERGGRHRRRGAGRGGEAGGEAEAGRGCCRRRRAGWSGRRIVESVKSVESAPSAANQESAR